MPINTKLSVSLGMPGVSPTASEPREILPPQQEVASWMAFLAKGTVRQFSDSSPRPELSWKCPVGQRKQAVRV